MKHVETIRYHAQKLSENICVDKFYSLMRTRARLFHLIKRGENMIGQANEGAKKEWKK